VFEMNRSSSPSLSMSANSMSRLSSRIAGNCVAVSSTKKTGRSAPPCAKPWFTHSRFWVVAAVAAVGERRVEVAVQVDVREGDVLRVRVC
jgi:hypothetical protein